MSVQIYDGLTPGLNQIASQMRNTQPLMRVVGGELRAAMQEHFRARGWSIYRKIATATALTSVTPTEAVVTVGGAEGSILLHKINGGLVRAKEAGALAIPLTNQAKRAGYARHFPKPLTLIKRRVGPPLLVEISRQKFTPHYVLKKSVFHRPDPKALPDKAAVELRIMARVRAFAAAVMRS